MEEQWICEIGEMGRGYWKEWNEGILWLGCFIEKKTKKKFWIEDVKYLSDIRLFKLILFKRYSYDDVYHLLYSLMMRRNKMAYTFEIT